MRYGANTYWLIFGPRLWRADIAKLGITLRLHIMIVSFVHNMLHYCLNLSLCCVQDLYAGIFPEPIMTCHPTSPPICSCPVLGISN